MKKLLLVPFLALALGLGACDSSDDGLMTIELASPKPVVTTNLATATITWPAIAKTAGYAYALDEQAEYTALEASTTTLKLTQLSKGAHTLRFYATGNLEHTTDSAVRTVEFEIDPTLPTPAPSYKKGENGATTLSWAAVAGAVGYAYKFNDDAAYTKVASTVLSIDKTGLDTEATNTFKIYAIGQSPDSEDSEVASLDFKLIDTSTGVWVRMADGSLTELTEATEKAIYTGTVSCKATDTFVVLIEDVTYGFTAYSGNGGVGTVNTVYAPVPFYTFSATEYVARESCGQMSAKEGDTAINSFWVNRSEACTINVRIDLSQEDAIPRYRLTLVEAEDPNLVLAQYFDLMVYGGDWTQPGKVGTSGPAGRLGNSTDSFACDGTEPATAAASYTAFGMKINYNSDADASEAYLANRNLTGWGLKNCYEFPGYLRLSNSVSGSTNLFGWITTPRLTKLTAASTVTLTFDALRFASSASIPVKVLGAGTISSASVNIEGSSSATVITPESDNQSILITSTHCPKHANEVAKAWSTFTVVIAGATADTQINWDTTDVNAKSNEGRICLDNIVIRKN